jgi:hypothetical protein
MQVEKIRINIAARKRVALEKWHASGVRFKEKNITLDCAMELEKLDA